MLTIVDMSKILVNKWMYKTTSQLKWKLLGLGYYMNSGLLWPAKKFIRPGYELYDQLFND